MDHNAILNKINRMISRKKNQIKQMEQSLSYEEAAIREKIHFNRRIDYEIESINKYKTKNKIVKAAFLDDIRRDKNEKRINNDVKLKRMEKAARLKDEIEYSELEITELEKEMLIIKESMSVG